MTTTASAHCATCLDYARDSAEQNLIEAGAIAYTFKTTSEGDRFAVLTDEDYDQIEEAASYLVEYEMITLCTLCQDHAEALYMNEQRDQAALDAAEDAAAALTR